MTSLGAPIARTILVVDDDQQIRDLLQFILERVGYAVHLASDGRSAVLWAEEYRGVVDLVLMNASMPAMSGHRASHRIKQLCPSAPIILMSGYALQHFEGIDGALSDISGFLKKPFKVAELYDLVEKSTCLDG
ncbi:MAG: response regulator [Pseudomonadales bacterium]